MKVVKIILNKIVPRKVKVYFAVEAVKAFKREQLFARLSYSQEGEDLILCRLLENKTKGFYVDVGAHHPKRFSNTYLFYKKGWHGLNIDAMPGSMQAFDKERPKDINLELGIAKSKGELVYHIFNESALNTFSTKEAKDKDGLKNYRIIDTQMIAVYPLKEIFDEYLRHDINIDFLNVDVEGLDLEVLESNDWEKYRPTIILVEDLQRSSLPLLIRDSNLYKYLDSLKYDLVAKSLNTLIFKDRLGK